MAAEVNLLKFYLGKNICIFSFLVMFKKELKLNLVENHNFFLNNIIKIKKIIIIIYYNNE